MDAWIVVLIVVVAVVLVALAVVVTLRRRRAGDVLAAPGAGRSGRATEGSARSGQERAS